MNHEKKNTYRILVGVVALLVVAVIVQSIVMARMSDRVADPPNQAIATAPHGRSWHEPKMHRTRSLPGIPRPSMTPPGEAVLLP